MTDYLSKIVASISDSMAKDINEDLFDRRKSKQIWEFIQEDLRSVEMLPDVYLRDVEYVSDPSKIDVQINKKIVKNKFILKNDITKLVPIQPDIFDAIKFTIKINGGESVENTILLPKYIDRYHFMISGNKTLSMFQVVDNAIYNRKGEVILKSRIQAKLSKEKRKATLLDVNSGAEFKSSTLVIDLFKKKFNPLYYFIAKKGMFETINMFGFKNYMNIVDKVEEPDLFYYFRINSNLLIEAEKTLFENDSFMRTFIAMFAQLFNSRHKIDDLYNNDLWTKRLGSLFTSSVKNQFNKGQDVLRSFRNALDNTAKNALKIDYSDKSDIYTVVRWVLREFNELRNMDNNTILNKRIRTNEYIAAHFSKFLKDKVNYALNMRPYDKDKLARLFKFDEHILIKALFRGKKPSPLFRYNLDVNDMQALNGLKFSITGIQGIPSDKVTNEQRDVYPSHLGRFELNAISSSSPGVSGMLTPFCKIYEGGYFGDAPTIEKPYIKKLKKRIKEIKSNEELYPKLKARFAKLKDDHEKRIIQIKYRDYRNENGYIEIIKPEYSRNIDGFIEVKDITVNLNYVRNDNGYIDIFDVRDNEMKSQSEASLVPSIYGRDKNGYIQIFEIPNGMYDSLKNRFKSKKLVLNKLNETKETQED